MTPEGRARLEDRILRQDHWLRILTAVMAAISLVLVSTLVWFSFTIQVSNQQILETLTTAIEQGNRQTPIVIQKLEDDIDARSKTEHDDTQRMIKLICRHDHIKC